MPQKGGFSHNAYCARCHDAAPPGFPTHSTSNSLLTACLRLLLLSLRFHIAFCIIQVTVRRVGAAYVSLASGMLEDKYIGLVLAFSGSLAIGTSFIITKKVCSCVLHAILCMLTAFT